MTVQDDKNAISSLTGRAHTNGSFEKLQEQQKMKEQKSTAMQIFTSVVLQASGQLAPLQKIQDYTTMEFYKM